MEAGRGRFKHVRNVADVRQRARRALPRAIFDYIDGAAEDEVSKARNRAQFDAWGFVPTSAVDVGAIDTRCTILGHQYAAPFGIGPTGLAALAWPDADVLLARAAMAANVPFCLSTVSSVELADAARRSQTGNWFQLYIFKDRGLSHDLLARAKEAGYRVLLVTVDCPTGGNRERDILNDFTLPLRPTWRNAFDMASRPGWLRRLAQHGAPKPENMVEASKAAASSAQGLVAFMSSQLDATVTWSDVAEVARRWDGPVVVKGLLAADDVRRAMDSGAHGVVLSNHGGRQLDGAVSPLHVLPAVRDTFGEAITLLCDSGFRRGTDILKAIALGADGVLMGRNTLYGVAMAGEAGVSHVLTTLRTELERAMVLLGTPTLEHVTRQTIMQLTPAPRSSSDPDGCAALRASHIR